MKEKWVYKNLESNVERHRSEEIEGLAVNMHCKFFNEQGVFVINIHENGKWVDGSQYNYYFKENNACVLSLDIEERKARKVTKALERFLHDMKREFVVCEGL